HLEANIPHAKVLHGSVVEGRGADRSSPTGYQVIAHDGSAVSTNTLETLHNKAIGEIADSAEGGQWNITHGQIRSGGRGVRSGEVIHGINPNEGGNEQVHYISLSKLGTSRYSNPRESRNAILTKTIIIPEKQYHAVMQELSANPVRVNELFGEQYHGYMQREFDAQHRPRTFNEPERDTQGQHRIKFTEVHANVPIERTENPNMRFHGAVSKSEAAQDHRPMVQPQHVAAAATPQELHQQYTYAVQEYQTQMQQRQHAFQQPQAPRVELHQVKEKVDLSGLDPAARNEMNVLLHGTPEKIQRSFGAVPMEKVNEMREFFSSKDGQSLLQIGRNQNAGRGKGQVHEKLSSSLAESIYTKKDFDIVGSLKKKLGIR
ncbi:MAG: hypothetical protein GOV15_03510, partial [Candidatus Diapherotrites archaeon]|nr:hypothetical protein [Candidatus Diapherotrites archaeon]